MPRDEPAYEQFQKRALAARGVAEHEQVAEPLGYVWFSELESAAGYVANQALSPESDNLGMVWIEHLARAKAEGAAPCAAVLSFCTLPDGPGGHVKLAEQATAPSLRDLAMPLGSAHRPACPQVRAGDRGIA